MSRGFVVAATVVAATLGVGTAGAANHYFPYISETAAARAQCGPDDLTERGIQGNVSAEDRNSGRSRQGYNCNMARLGGVRGAGGGIVSVTSDHCSYTSSLFPSSAIAKQPGVQIVDARNPRKPRVVGSLTTPAMVGGTWESLKVNHKRKLLAATSVPFLWGGGFFSVYDISDCAHPKLLNKGAGTAWPLPFTSHEGGFSPDGRTYWASGVYPGHLSAIDISNPAKPSVIWQGLHSFLGHGFGISPDGNHMFLSNMAGITVLDISAIQRRAPYPQVPHVAAYLWPDGQLNQHSIPVTYQGRRHLFSLDEAGSGGVKVFDIHKLNKPKLITSIKLEINLPKNQDTLVRSSSGGSLFGSNPHYCSVDRPNDPTALACSWESSGIRVFDIRNLNKIREIGYYNPPAQKNSTITQLPNSPHVLGSIIGMPVLEFLSLGMSMANGKVSVPELVGPRSGMIAGGDMATDWCFSPPEFHGNQIWSTCSDGGFMALELSGKVYTPPADQASTHGSD
ncbi:LVIVD repeat-containing protein [Gordonia sp. CPCC 205333]|uniref:LVIVD repeat-containing protein n=1 Tax=Gordonia sp. CPCC 205333 TaxID=3140790 RepID=UPI003AF3DF59